MELPIAIFDDDLERGGSLLSDVERCLDGPKAQCKLLTSPQELVMSIAREDVKVLFAFTGRHSCGIEGIDFVNSLLRQGNNVVVVFYSNDTSSFDARVYQERATLFLPLTHSAVELDYLLKRVRDLTKRLPSRSLCVQKKGRIVVVQTREITYVESDRRILHVHTVSETVDAYGKLSSIQEELPEGFIQCHKSFLVNLRYVKESYLDTLRLVTGETVPVSQKRRKYTKDCLISFVRSGTP